MQITDSLKNIDKEIKRQKKILKDLAKKRQNIKQELHKYVIGKCFNYNNDYFVKITGTINDKVLRCVLFGNSLGCLYYNSSDTINIDLLEDEITEEIFNNELQIIKNKI